jgi:hypothetical protein
MTHREVGEHDVVLWHEAHEVVQHIVYSTLYLLIKINYKYNIEYRILTHREVGEHDVVLRHEAHEVVQDGAALEGAVDVGAALDLGPQAQAVGQGRDERRLAAA